MGMDGFIIRYKTPKRKGLPRFPTQKIPVPAGTGIFESESVLYYTARKNFTRNSREIT